MIRISIEFRYEVNHIRDNLSVDRVGWPCGENGRRESDGIYIFNKIKTSGGSIHRGVLLCQPKFYFPPIQNLRRNLSINSS